MFEQIPISKRRNIKCKSDSPLEENGEKIPEDMNTNYHEKFYQILHENQFLSKRYNIILLILNYDLLIIAFSINTSAKKFYIISIMEKLSQYDPLAITSIDFNIKSVKKYTSIVTIFVSVAIIVLSIIISFQSIRHIWLQRNQLPITYSLQKRSQYGLSQGNPLCIASIDTFSYLPRLTIFKKEGNIIIEESRESLEGVGQFYYMKKYVEGKNYACFDLAGVSFQEEGEQIFVDTGIQLPGSFQAMFRLISVTQILNYQQPQIKVMQYINTYFSPFIELNFIEITLYDLLLFNYEPQVVKGFYKNPLSRYYYSYENPVNGKVAFKIKNNFQSTQSANIHKYTLQRQNIGEILSQVLAWQGLILIPIAFIFMLLAFVDSFLKADLIKARYTCPELDSLDFSVWTDIRRKFTACCQLPKERVLNLAFDSIDNELDILQILRKQVVMKQRISEVCSIEKEKDIFACEFEHEDNAELLQLEDCGSSYWIDNDQKDAQYDFKEQEIDEGILDKVSAIAKLFDETETPIQVLANAGKGYGSVWNMIALFVLSAGLLCGLILMGLFQVSTDVSFRTGVLVEESDFIVTLSQQNIAFRPELEKAFRVPSRWHYQAQILDNNYNLVENVVIVSGSHCTVPPGGEGFIWFCFAKDVKLVTKDSYKTFLLLEYKTNSTSRFDQMYLKTIKTIFYSRQQNYQNGNQQIWQKILGLLASKHYQIYCKKIIIAKDDKKSQSFSFIKREVLPLNGNGFFINGYSKMTYVDIQPASYWELLDNAWGLVILSFELIIYRICTAINSLLKKRKVDPLKEEQRSNILSILNDIDRLGKGTYCQQLRSVRYFFKQKVEQNSVDL